LNVIGVVAEGNVFTAPLLGRLFLISVALSMAMVMPALLLSSVTHKWEVEERRRHTSFSIAEYINCRHFNVQESCLVYTSWAVTKNSNT
jgi:hypothetical protein